MSKCPGFILGIAIILFMALPLGVAMLTSFEQSSVLQFPPSGFSLEWYAQAFRDNDLWRGLGTSILIFGLVAITACGLGWFCCWLDFFYPRMRPWIILTILPPLLIPIAALAQGYAQLLRFIEKSDSILGFFLAYAFLCTTVTYTVGRGMFGGRIHRLLDLHQVLGGSRASFVPKVGMRVMWVAVLATFLLGFLFAFDEVVVASFIGGTYVKPYALLLYSSLRFDLTPKAMAFGCSVLLVNGAGFLILLFAIRRRVRHGL